MAGRTLKRLLSVLWKEREDIWRQRLRDSRAETVYLNGDLESGFPFMALSDQIAVYLRRRRISLNTPESDVFLDRFILEHFSDDEIGREIAILASLRAFTEQAARSSMVRLLMPHTPTSDIVRYLRCLVFAYQANPLAVCLEESEAAIALLHMISKAEDPFWRLEGFVEYIGKPGNIALFPLAMVHAALRTSDFRNRLDRHLETLRTERKFLSAYKLVRWLASVAELRDSLPAKQLIVQHFPNWRNWAPWRPNLRRIVEWEGGRFTETQRHKLAPVLTSKDQI